MTLKSIMPVFAETPARPGNDETKQFNEFEIRSHSQLESSNHNSLRTKKCWALLMLECGWICRLCREIIVFVRKNLQIFCEFQQL